MAAALGPRGAAVLADSAARGLALLERARERGLGTLSCSWGRIPPSSAGRCPWSRTKTCSLARAGRDAGGFGYDPRRGELSFVGDTAEAVRLELETQRRALREEAAERAAAPRRDVGHASPDPRLGPSPSGGSCAELRGGDSRRGAPPGPAARGVGPRRGRRGARGRAAGAGRGERWSCGAALDASRPSPGSMSSSRGWKQSAKRRSGDSRTAGGEPADGAGGSRREARAAGAPPGAARRCQPVREGRVRGREGALCPSCARSGRTWSVARRARKLRDDLTETVDRRFTETFDAVERNFAEVASTLFPGGKGRLRLTEPEEEAGARDRGRALAGGQEDHAALAPLRRREGARRDLVPVRALPRAAVPVLPARRGRGRARRHEHRPVLRRSCAASPTARSSSSSRTRSGRWRQPTRSTA